MRLFIHGLINSSGAPSLSTGRRGWTGGRPVIPGPGAAPQPAGRAEPGLLVSYFQRGPGALRRPRGEGRCCHRLQVASGGRLLELAEVRDLGTCAPCAHESRLPLTSQESLHSSNPASPLQVGGGDGSTRLTAETGALSGATPYPWQDPHRIVQSALPR